MDNRFVYPEELKHENRILFDDVIVFEEDPSHRIENTIFWSSTYLALLLAAVRYEVVIFKNKPMLLQVFLGALYSAVVAAYWTVGFRYFRNCKAIASVLRKLAVVCFLFMWTVVFCAALAYVFISIESVASS